MSSAVRSLVLLLTCALGCQPPDASESIATASPPAPSGQVRVVPRSTVVPTYPCARCHDERASDPHERPLEELHQRIAVAHGSAEGWCYRCHVEGDPDRFRLQDGRIAGFDESHELCMGCHGEIAADWRDGIHGLTTGRWNGPRDKRSCTACHDPHAPRFPAMIPRPAPRRPRSSWRCVQG